MLWLTRALPVKADYTSPACYCTPNRTMINLIVEWIQNMRPTCCHDDPFKFKYSNIGPTQVLRILLHILPIQNFESCVLGDGCPKCHVVHPPWEVSSSVVHRWVQQYTPCVLLYRFPPFHVTTDSLSFLSTYLLLLSCFLKEIILAESVFIQLYLHCTPGNHPFPPENQEESNGQVLTPAVEQQYGDRKAHHTYLMFECGVDAGWRRVQKSRASKRYSA
jgi:hypothetical protein